MNKYSAKGYITFYYTKDGLKYDIDEKEDVLEPFQGEDFFHWFEKNTGHLMDGKKFYDCVDSGVLIDYDGTLGDVYVDGYISNLGLKHKNVCQGKMLLDGFTWLDICKRYKVEIDWYNK